MNKVDKERASELHKKSIIIDGLQAVFDVSQFEGRYYNELKEAGITAANYTVTGAFDTPVPALNKISPYYDFVEKHTEGYMLVAAARDVEEAKRQHKVGIIMGSQNASMLGGDLRLLRIYKQLGLRIIQPSYYAQNLLGEGIGERTNGGLTNFGLEVVEEMNRLGLVIDLSHCGDQATADAIKYSTQPVILSHCNPRGIVNHRRNTPDELIKAMAEKGGVIGICAFSVISEVRKDVRPTIEDFFIVLEYALKLVGPEHVGIGLDAAHESLQDYNAWAPFAQALIPKGGWVERSIFTGKDGWDDVSNFWPKITEGLVARGYSDRDIQKILGLNFLRVFKEVWGE